MSNASVIIAKMILNPDKTGTAVNHIQIYQMPDELLAYYNDVKVAGFDSVEKLYVFLTDAIKQNGLLMAMILQNELVNFFLADELIKSYSVLLSPSSLLLLSPLFPPEAIDQMLQDLNVKGEVINLTGQDSSQIADTQYTGIIN